MRLFLLIAAALAAITLVGCGVDQNRAPAGSDGTGHTLDPSGEWSTDFARSIVPLNEIVSGGPGRDGIPAIDEPHFISAEAAEFLGDREPLMVVTLGDQVRAYPIRILIWHEIVNDTLAGRPITITYCPLCNSALVFDRRVDGRTLDFGTTGRLRNSDLVMYDRQTESWWQQFTGEAIVGELAGLELETVPARIVAAGPFRADNPSADVLSERTGHDRPYGTNPYTGYDSPSSPLYFGADNADDRRLDAKERVVFIERGDEALVVPFSALEKAGSVEVRLGDERLTVRWRPGVSSALDNAGVASGRDVGAADVVDGDGRAVPFAEPFWFAVAAFRPDVVVVAGD